VNTVATEHGYELCYVINAPALADSRVELKLRRLYRGLFLDPSLSDEQKCVWFCALLSGYTPRQQARLLFVLYGPVSQGMIT
jgi:hypothetical protein